MNYQDWLVGIVAGVIGAITFLAGALNWEWTYQYRPARWVEAAWGRVAARVFYALLGLLLIGLGVAISQGWGLYRSAPRTAGSPATTAWVL